ncbi:MAG: hypothetical protein R2711_10480 [Acidimicrobiales bacterium]
MALAVAGNALLVAMWAWSRTAGLPWGESPGVAEEVGPIDLATVLLQVVAVAVGARLLLAPADHRSTGRSADRAGDGRRRRPGGGAGGHLVARRRQPQPRRRHAHRAGPRGREGRRARCDRDVNPPAYWEEAEALGVDTRWAGAPPGVAATTSSDGHDHGGGATTDGGTTTTTRPDPLAGRGSAGLDQLVSATALAATSEIEAANLITQLSHATDEDYDAWLWWLQTSGSLAHDHSSTFTSEDGSGHGGYVGPQPWKALTDPADCERLHEELALAADGAPVPHGPGRHGRRLPPGGPHLPGIAPHFIKSSLIDGSSRSTSPRCCSTTATAPTPTSSGSATTCTTGATTSPPRASPATTTRATATSASARRRAGIIGDSTTTEEDARLAAAPRTTAAPDG